MPSIDTVNDITPRRQYTALAAQDAFDFPFPIFEDSDLVVDVDGTTLALDVDYIVSGAGDDTGGSILLTTPAVGGEIVTIYRDIAIARDTDFQQNGPFRSAAINDELDKAFLIMQELESKLGRALRLPITAEATDAQTLFSPLVNWLGKYITINAQGVPEPAALSDTTMTQSTIGALLYPQTQAESDAGVTPTDYSYPPGDVRRYGGNISQWLTCGESKLIARGTLSVASQVTATIAADTEVDAHGAVFSYSGSASTDNMLFIECDGYSLKWSGGKLDGNDLIAGGFRIENNDAMSDATLPVCHLEDCTIQDFKMNSEGSYNNGALIRGSFEEVVVRNNAVRNITRASGAGTPSVTGTAGVQVGWITSSKYVRHCIHEGNVYSGILGGDAVGSSDNVDYDGFMFFAPDPTNFPNVDSTVYGYPICTVYSRGNSYRNCRGRAMKVQGLANIKGEKVIRDDDYTIYGGSDEINVQWGVGTIEDIEFHYHDYAGPTSPIQTTLTLVSAYQGSWYNENHAGLTVRGVRVYNAVKSGVGEPIYTILAANAGATPQTKQRNFIKLEDVAVNRGVVQFILTSSMDDAAPAVIHMRDITVPELQYSAVGAGTNHAATQLIASGVMNMDGVITPANAVPFVSDTSTPGGARTWGGRMHGAMNGGFENSYRSGVGADAAPALLGAALGDALNTTGGLGSVQSVVVDDDDTYAFGIRGYSPGVGLVLIGCGYDYVSQAVLAVSDSQAHVIAAHASHVFDASVSGSNPDTDGKLNVWVDSGVINIKNRLGSTRAVTMMFLG